MKEKSKLFQPLSDSSLIVFPVQFSQKTANQLLMLLFSVFIQSLEILFKTAVFQKRNKIYSWRKNFFLLKLSARKFLLIEKISGFNSKRKVVLCGKRILKRVKLRKLSKGHLWAYLEPLICRKISEPVPQAL